MGGGHRRMRSVAINYIECSVGATGTGGAQTGFPVPPPAAPTSMFDQMINNEPEVVVPTAVPSGGPDVAERLRRLEDVKDIITEQEYTQRRKEILAQI